jgi:hypothetical protein
MKVDMFPQGSWRIIHGIDQGGLLGRSRHLDPSLRCMARYLCLTRDAPRESRLQSFMLLFANTSLAAPKAQSLKSQTICPG